ncbi:MAG: rRNA methyltransferase, partial [Chitinophagia bacterium]|nr:rRNA methyltransferase [Chitinophagia bacterium]
EDFLPEISGKGWHVIKFNNQGLGWAKLLGNRVNNYLPKHLRIRMELPDER